MEAAPLGFGSQSHVLSPLHPSSSLGPFPNQDANSCTLPSSGKEAAPGRAGPVTRQQDLRPVRGGQFGCCYERLSRAQRWNLFPLNDFKCQAARPQSSLCTHGWLEARQLYQAYPLASWLLLGPLQPARRETVPELSLSNELSRGHSGPSRLRDGTGTEGCCFNELNEIHSNADG
jgi:hypothetical protein